MTEARAPGLDRQGAYDQLYQAMPLVWSASPGRMVARAAELLPPGRALDLGCGDGRNAVWLEQRGWSVDGVDISRAALAAADRRYAAADHHRVGRLWLADASTARFPAGEYDLVLTYGLYHCIPDDRIDRLHMSAIRALRSGGLMAFSALDNRRPLPKDHTTGMLWLRSPSELRRLMSKIRLLEWEEGEIREDHRPLVGPHCHAAVWALAAA